MINSVPDYEVKHPPVFTFLEWSAIESYLNENLYNTRRNLEKKDLGDIEREQMERQVPKMIDFMKRIDNNIYNNF